jgi:hypothetical protein
VNEEIEGGVEELFEDENEDRAEPGNSSGGRGLIAFSRRMEYSDFCILFIAFHGGPELPRRLSYFRGIKINGGPVH